MNQKMGSLIPLLLLMTSCSITSGDAVTAGMVAARMDVPHRSEIVPLTDHHVHLLGPFALPLPDPLPLEIALPAELQRLLSDRARLVGNVTGPIDLDQVFTEDAQLLNAYVDPTGWMRERVWFERYLNLGQRGRSRFVPNQFATSGTRGFIAGTVLDVPSGTHVQNFLFAIERGRDGKWRIAADSTTPKTAPRYTAPITADRLIRDLDQGGIRRAVVLSEAFWISHEGPDRQRRLTEMPDEQSAVRAENDWTAREAARYPDRLVFACAVNPLRDYAVAEVRRCATDLNARALKLNFSNLVNYDDAGHVEALRRIFATANEHRVAIVAHIEPGRAYGPREVEIFLDQIVSAAPDIPIQIAHMAGNGPGITSPEALAAFAEARQARDPRTRNLYFDFAGLIYRNMPAAAAELMATRMRQIGLDRILYGSDSSPGLSSGNPPTFDHWEWTRRLLPLTDEELMIVARNEAPYLR